MNKCKTCGIDIKPKRKYCSNNCKFKDTSYNTSRCKKNTININNNVKCSLCEYVSNDGNNISGALTRHINKSHSDIIFHISLFNKIDIERNRFKCPLCEWSTLDITNKSGALTTHLMKIHSKSIPDFLKIYPELTYMWKTHELFLERNTILKNKGYIQCEICGEKLKKISNTHLKLHNINTKQYKNMFNINNICSVYSSELHRNAYINNTNIQLHNYRSKPEIEISNYIESLGLKVENNTRHYINGNELDIYIPELKIAIEYNGLYWHREESIGKEYHINKLQSCEESGIRLIQIFEDEWINNKELVLNRLIHILHKDTTPSIFARKCKVKHIDNKLKNEFLNKYHIQGSDNSSYRYGLFYNDVLVAVMTFSKLRKFINNKHNDGYELVRYATNTVYRIIGGGSKLLSTFKKEINPLHITTYADRRWTSSISLNMYDILKFNRTSMGKPGYWYISNTECKRIHRYRFTKYNLIKMGLDPSKSERELTTELGYNRIWDCGNLKYEWIL